MQRLSLLGAQASSGPWGELKRQLGPAGLGVLGSETGEVQSSGGPQKGRKADVVLQE